MAPIKFEEQIKDKMEERRMQPSVGAWDKLNSRLDEANETKKNKGFFWIGIAASVIGVALAVTLFMKPNRQISTESIIVDTETKNDVQNNKIDEVKEKNKVPADKKEELKIKRTDNKVKKASKNSPLLEKARKEQAELTRTKNQNVIAEVNTNKVKEDINKGVIQKKQTLEEAKAEEVVAQILNLKKENKAVSEENINTLLDAAYKEITLDKLLKKDSKTVDADALLESVEDELEQSFRTRVFEMLKSSYKEVKTAVAERNN